MKELKEEDNKYFDALAFEDIVEYIEDHQHKEMAPIFKLADLIKIYQNRYAELELNRYPELVQNEVKYVQSTRFKERLLTHFPDLLYHS